MSATYAHMKQGEMSDARPSGRISAWYGDISPMTSGDWDNFDDFRRRHARGIDFEYDFEEIVQTQGVGMLRLKSALNRMPDRIAATEMLFKNGPRSIVF